MAIELKIHTNGDDALVAWRPNPWKDAWIGFRLERKDKITGEILVINNRIPPRAGEGEVPAEGISSALSPIRRCVWIDHSVDEADQVSYRVTPIVVEETGSFAPAENDASDWTAPALVTRNFGDGISACFNRGTIMSQVVSRIVGEVSVAALKNFRTQLSNSGFPGRRYLAGDLRHAILNFLADADRRGNHIFAALYEINDQELRDALKVFGQRGHLLIGNGSATTPDVADEMEAALLEVKHRDLSKLGASSPSVHNKFVVEVSGNSNQAIRVLTGSTNWTTTGLCTQLNNVLIVDRPATAGRFLKQWNDLVDAGDDLTRQLVAANNVPFEDGPVTTHFSATTGAKEFKPVLDLIRNARTGLHFLMFMPGQSPLLSALLDRARETAGPYVRGIVSEVRESANGMIVSHKAQVVKTGVEPEEFKDSALLPDGLPADSLPSWAREEFQRRMYLPARLNAIVHSKVIVVDPFSEDCAVVTGSHNFSPTASTRNDENLVIIRNNKALAQAYALHIAGVYDHFSWRAFLSNGGNPDSIFKPLDGWKPGGSREKELEFWMR